MILLGSVAAMAVAAAGVLWYIQTQPVDIHAIVDAETRSIVWTTKYRDRIETDRVMFDEVAKIEHSAHGDTFQIVAVTNGGERKVISERNHNLDSDGRRYAQMIGKPYEDVDPAVQFERDKH